MGRPKTDYLLVPEIEKVLMACSDGSCDKSTNTATPSHTITITGIHKELIERFDHAVDPGVIRRVLHARNDGPFDETPVWIGDLTNASLWCFAVSEKEGSTRHYFVVRNINKSQILYLAQLLRSTSSSGNANDALYTLTSELCEDDQESFWANVKETLIKPNPLGVRFADTLLNIEVLQEAIDKRQPVNYRYISNNEKGIPKKERIPLCVEISEGYPYVVEKAKNGFRLVRIDAMRDVAVGNANNVHYYPKGEGEFESLQKGAHAFVRGAVNRMGGNNVHIVARCHQDHMKKYVRDIFGNKEGFRELPMSHEGCQDYEFWAAASGAEIQALKWVEWFEIREPQWLRDKVIASIKDNAYGQFREAPKTPKRSVTVHTGPEA